MKSDFILSFWFLVCKSVFLLKIFPKDKNTKSQPKKTRCEIVNFESAKLAKPKTISRNTIEWYNIFIVIMPL